jgi:hypothetical protein
MKLTGNFWIILFGLLASIERSLLAADESVSPYSSIHGQLTASLTNSPVSTLGGQFEAAGLFRPFSSKPNMTFGPRAGVLWMGNTAPYPVDLQIGAEGTLWVMNKVGIGLGSDLMIPQGLNSLEDKTRQSTHYRFGPYLAIRLQPFRKEGAWAIRMGMPYDTRSQWGIQAGVSLQLNGVQRLGET